MSAEPTRGNALPKSVLDEDSDELYEMAPCGYLTTDPAGRIIKANKTLIDWLGYEREELIGGKRFVDLLTVGGRMFYETHFSLLLRMKEAVDEIALDLRCKDSHLMPALINARQKQDGSGSPVLHRFTIFNASERRRYERDLLAARDLFRTTLSSIGDAVVATDSEGRITFMNPVAEGLTGFQSDEGHGRQIEEVLLLRRENSSVRVENPIRKALREDIIVGLANHTVLVTKAGHAIPIDDSASPIRDANGATIGAVLVFRDISAQRKNEKDLIDAHHLLEDSAAELRRSNEDLSQFAHVASHDLRSPLNTVIQFSQLLEQKYGEKLGDGKELLDYVISSATRMQSLIEDLLSYARVSTEASRSQIVDANLRLETAIENLRGPIEATGAVITHEALPDICLSGTSLAQLFQNLLGNAIHYRSEATPRIHISAVVHGDQWLFACKDNGIGIAPEHQVQIFAAFKRLHGSDRPGSGIGLAICKKIVEHYKGRIWVESIVNQGSTFFFTLPKAMNSFDGRLRALSEIE